jgi:hypothetical protein
MGSDQAVRGTFNCRFSEPFARVRADGGKELPQGSFRNGDNSIINFPSR